MIKSIIVNNCLVFISLWIIKKYFDNIFEKKQSHDMFGIISWAIVFVFQVFAENRRGIPSLIVLSLNIVLVLVVCIVNYYGILQRKIIYSILLYLMWMTVESVLYQILIIFPVGNKDIAILGSVVSKIIMIFFVILLRILVRKEDNRSMPLKYIFALLIIPISSIFIVHNIFISIKINLEQSMISMVSFSLILLINVTIFEVYTRLLEYFELQQENLVFEQQLELMDKHIQEREVATASVVGLRHDLKSHLIYLYDTIDKRQDQIALNYIKDLLQIMNYNNEDIVKSGNAVVDSLINYKCNICKENDICIVSNLFIPAQLPIRDTDLCIILGNALDNAIEAANMCKENKSIEIFMGCKKNALSIVIKNSYTKVAKRDLQGNLITTKKDKYSHGMGIVAIKKAISKYNGEIVIEECDGTFCLVVMLDL